MRAASVLDPYLTDWLNLLLRWLHVIASIAWIGASFYFVLLDSSLRPPKRLEDAEAGVGGELWEVHGGGFYHVQKYRVAPPRLPEQLAWFKWEAYTTWLSGFGLMILLYYFEAGTYLIDRSIADLSTRQAVGVSLGLLAVAWIVYDALCRILAGRELLLWIAIVGLVALATWGATELFAPRAAFLQIGAMLGTAMAGNVFFNIIPAHRELIRAKEAGREPDPKPGAVAKQRSVHNNYFTLPVLLTMLGGHFAFLYGTEHTWVVLLALMVVAAWTRLFFNLRHTGRTIWAIPVIGAGALLVLALAIRPESDGAGGSRRPVAFATVRSIVAERCAPCHAAEPTREGFSSPPAGVLLETREQLVARADDVKRVVAGRSMPLGNVTGMTDGERALVVAWVDQGAETG
jgi:uncharacterized membrane protein